MAIFCSLKNKEALSVLDKASFLSDHNTYLLTTSETAKTARFKNGEFASSGTS